MTASDASFLEVRCEEGASRAGSDKKEKAEAMVQQGTKDVDKNEDGKEGKERR